MAVLESQVVAKKQPVPIFGGGEEDRKKSGKPLEATHPRAPKMRGQSCFGVLRRPLSLNIVVFALHLPYFLSVYFFSVMAI